VLLGPRRPRRSLARASHGHAASHLDLRSEFRAGVVDPFLAGYAGGETPNPCVGCNGHVRLDAMISLADRLGAADLATGHYARLSGGLLRAAADPAKDQTYMLAALAPQSLARLRFPLGELTKPEVRALAAEAELPVASKADSMDLCFLAGTGKAAFLARHAGLEDREGEIVDTRGDVLGRHAGFHHFTVGQRRGLGVQAGGAVVCAAHGGTREPRRRRDALRARDHASAFARRSAAPARRRGRRRAAALPLARGALSRGARIGRRGA
jgi:tRNA-specific 2-thiouridylase